MQQYKRRQKRRTRGKFIRKNNKTSTIGNIARSALRIGKFVKSVLNVEYKLTEREFTNQIIPSTGVIYPLSLIAQGDTKSGRNGNQVRAKGVNLRISLDINPASTLSQQIVRMILFIDASSNGVVPTISQLLDQQTITSPIRQFYNSDYGKRFHVLMDKTRTLISGQSQIIYIKKWKKLNHLLEFTGSTGLQTNLTTGHIYLMFISTDANDGPIMYGGTRVTFVDN